MPRILGSSKGRYYVYIDDVPLVGHIAFGIIDRGTNVLQVRPTTLCPLNCIFCSVDAGPHSRTRLSEYIVDPQHLYRWFRTVVSNRDEVVEALIDGVGEPPTHPSIVEIVRLLKRCVPRVAMESHGAVLTKKLIDRLDEAGLDRINLSIDTLDPEKARYLQGVEWFDVRKVIEIAEYIVNNTKIDLHLTPVWIPGINDEDIKKIVEWGLRIGAGKRFPPFGIQKYEIHRYGRKVPGVREVSWSEFWEFIHSLEKEFGVDLDYRKLMDRFGMRRVRRRYPIKYSVGDVVELKIVGPGWLRGEMLAVDLDEDVIVTVVGLKKVKKFVKAKIVHNKDGIYIARP